MSVEYPDRKIGKFKVAAVADLETVVEKFPYESFLVWYRSDFRYHEFHGQDEVSSNFLETLAKKMFEGLNSSGYLCHSLEKKRW